MLTCLGLGTAGGFVPTGKLAGPLEDVKSLDGARISVGSKNFSENMLLGKMAIILMQSGGAKVKDLTNIPGSASARQAMLDGPDRGDVGVHRHRLDHLPRPRQADPRRGEAVRPSVRDEDAKKNDLDWLPPAPMNNTYGFAVTQKDGEEVQASPSSRSSRSCPVSERTFCVESELINRPDGLKGMLKKYGVPLGGPRACPARTSRPSRPVRSTTRPAKGECNFGEVFTTDGRIVALDLKVLEDDRKFFPNYNVSLVLAEEAARRSTRRSRT